MNYDLPWFLSNSDKTEEDAVSSRKDDDKSSESEPSRPATFPPSKWIVAGLEIGGIVEKKNAAYGDSVRKSSQIMQILYPRGVSHSQIPAALLVVRILDKLCRISNDPDFGGEDPALDIAGYGLLLSDLVRNGL